ncbi:MAG: glycosyl hydrolase family 18 protein [Bacteroidota bacterium]|nr:glycosyl hydrolase family 18 protein [Bacteroidota bacterium]
MKICIPLILIFFYVNLLSQTFIPHSIHQEQSIYYKKSPENQSAEIIQNADSLMARRASSSEGQNSPESFRDQNSKPKTQNSKPRLSYQLQKNVFGYHPYWMENTFLNYPWDLLSDFCYFSYEVEAATGDPVTTHDWLTADAVDSALANGTRAHLCVTLFSSHSTFFNSPAAQQNLIDHLVWYIQQRNAHGVNLDFEAVPYSLLDEYQDFIMDFSDQFHAAIPDGIVSIAMPAVDWSGLFDVEMLSNYIDLFMIMGYDYYWNGSSQAGPVAPLYSLTDTYDYNLSRTISYYQSEGIPLEKMLLGQPYYARQWPVQGPNAPSNTSGNGTAYTYANIQNNGSGFYSPENRNWEDKSFSNYYAFQINEQWYQCFLEEAYGLGKRYDIVNRRQLAGIGIWALGYDDGYSELWELIADKFTLDGTAVSADTIFDSGGPAWDYYDHEVYAYVIGSEVFDRVSLSFEELDLEPGYDTLWIYDGPDTLSPLIGKYSGNVLPDPVFSSQPYLCLYFSSDAGVSLAGWKAIYSLFWYTGTEENMAGMISLRPNPFSDELRLLINSDRNIYGRVRILDLNGRCLIFQRTELQEGKNEIRILTNELIPGTYLLNLELGGEKRLGKKLIKMH